MLNKVIIAKDQKLTDSQIDCIRNTVGDFICVEVTDNVTDSVTDSGTLESIMESLRFEDQNLIFATSCPLLLLQCAILNGRNLVFNNDYVGRITILVPKKGVWILAS